MRRLIPTKRTTIVLLLFLVLAGGLVFRFPYIPEARQPNGFPEPGTVGEVVVKDYPSYRQAVVASPQSGQNQMFGKLFNHIKRNKIAMTAPVEMTYGESGPDSMAFLYESQQLGQLGSEGPVDVVDRPAMQVVSVAIRGSYTQSRFEERKQQLQDWLDENLEWVATGDARYLAYNSPFVPPFLRYGEVQIPVRRQNLASN